MKFRGKIRKQQNSAWCGRRIGEAHMFSVLCYKLGLNIILFFNKMHFIKQNQPILNNMTLFKVEKVYKKRRKMVWSKGMIVSCDVICSVDKKMVLCAFPRSM